MSRVTLLVFLLFPTVAFAHAGHAEQGVWWEPLLLGLAVVAVALYLRGVSRLWRAAGEGRGVPRRQVAAFVAGWVVLVAAVVPPVLRIAEASFSMHMVEHEALMVAAAPLLVAGRPLVPWLWAFAPATRRRLARTGSHPILNRPWRLLTHPAAAWGLHGAALWAWHMPAPFAAAVASPALHLAQHFSFLGTALLFWWSLLNGAHATRHGAALVSLFTTVLHTSVLGALIAVSPLPWYDGVDLADQQMAGVLMWVPGGLVYVGVALWLAVDWLRLAEARTRAWEARLGGAGVG